jgi:hypothetical protein
MKKNFLATKEAVHLEKRVSLSLSLAIQAIQEAGAQD